MKKMLIAAVITILLICLIIGWIGGIVTVWYRGYDITGFVILLVPIIIAIFIDVLSKLEGEKE